MTTSTARDRTEVGNYFIANYPPFSVWKKEAVETDARPALGVAAGATSPLGLYLHIPFCRKRCHFCYFRVYTDKNAERGPGLPRRARARMGAVQRAAGDRRPAAQLRLLRRRHAVVHLDARSSRASSRGWTPSARGDRPRRSRSSASRARSPRASSRAIREHRRHAAQPRRRELRRSRFSKRTAARTARRRSARPTRSRGRSTSRRSTSTSSPACSARPTTTGTRASQKTIDMAPDSVTIYQMELPFNTTISRNLLTGGRRRADGSGRELVDQAPLGRRRRSRRSKRPATSIGSAYTAVKNPSTKFVYRDRLWQGADMVGLGVASFGHVNGVHMQNLDTFEAYCASDRGGRAAARPRASADATRSGSSASSCCS